MRINRREWALVYLIKQAMPSVAQIVGTAGTSTPELPKVWSLSDQQELDKLYAQLPPSPRRVPTRRLLARLKGGAR